MNFEFLKLFCKFSNYFFKNSQSWQHCTYLNALNISKNTKHVNVIVVSLGVILPSSRVILNTHVVPHMIMKALNKMLNIRPRVRICSLTFLGGFFSTSGSTGSSPRLWAESKLSLLVIG